MHSSVVFSSCFFNFFLQLIWLKSISIFLHCFCYIKWSSENCFFFVLDSWDSFLHQVLCELQKIDCILLNFNQKVQMSWNSEYVTDFFNCFSICFFLWFVFDCFSHSDIEVKKCLYWLVIWNFVQLICYLTVYQLIMNNQKNKDQIYDDLAFMKITCHHVCKNDQH